MERHGWRLYAHALFLAQLHRLVRAVERAKRADPEGWRTEADARLLAALSSLVLDRRGCWACTLPFWSPPSCWRWFRA